MEIITLLAADFRTTGLPRVGATGVQLGQIVQVILAILGAVAVLMVVVAGLRYTTSQGNPQEVAKAKNTAIYAMVGLLLAIFAESVVTLVLSRMR